MSANSYKLIASIPTIKASHTSTLEKGRRYLLGSAEMEPDMLVFALDRSISRRQAWVEVVDEVLQVERHSQASQNLNGNPAVHTLLLKPGETFTAGLTIFQFVVAEAKDISPAPDLTYTLSARDFSAKLQEHGTRSFLEVVSKMPSLMYENETPTDFLLALCDTLQTHVAGIQVAAWSVHLHPDRLEVTSLSRSGLSEKLEGTLVPARPSHHLVRQAFSSTGIESVVSFWTRSTGGIDKGQSIISSGAEWAMRIPISLSENEHFALYATGKQTLLGAEQREIQQILAALGALVKQHLLAARAKERQGQIGQFFSPGLRSILFGETAGADQSLRPGEYDATICFFDLRESSRVAEEVGAAGRMTVAEHFALLENLLGEATGVVFETGGIVIDFQGDAILSCWGVPPQSAPMDPTRQAGIAARRIVEMMKHAWPRGESNLRCGIGITRGRVLAGLFTAQCANRNLLSKYTVMGAPVNQASRLEGMTKKFGVPILVDGVAAAALGDKDFLVRRIAAVRPAGMTQVVQVYELVLPRELGGTGVTAEGAKAYEAALAFFEEGNFDAAAEAMRLVPHDQIELFLSEQIITMRRQGPPSGWDGVINLLSK